MVSVERSHPATPPPGLGADNDTVWRDLGLSPREIAGLRADGVI